MTDIGIALSSTEFTNEGKKCYFRCGCHRLTCCSKHGSTGSSIAKVSTNCQISEDKRLFQDSYGFQRTPEKKNF